MGCFIEVDVNGEEIFFVDKGILTSFSIRLRKLLDKPSVDAAAKNPKVVFRDFPGGAAAFELLTRFCYANGRIEVIPANTLILHCAARFMEMPDLIQHADKSLKGMPMWSWADAVAALKQCQDLFLLADLSRVVDRILDSIVARIAAAGDASPTGSSPESSAFRYSFDAKSTVSTKSYGHCAWWFDDLAVLQLELLERFVKSLISRRVGHVTISRFLFYHLKCRLSAADAFAEKKKIITTAINLLDLLDRSSVSFKGLFKILRISASLNLDESYRCKLEAMIGCQIDQASLDDLLIPAPTGAGSLYDVALILRFFKSFLKRGGCESDAMLKRASNLLDLYLAEVAPDPSLKPAVLVELTTLLPPAARDCHDALYRAIEIYLQVHAGLSDEEKTEICRAICHEKLSSECRKHLAKSVVFPTRTAIRALASQQSMLKSLIHDASKQRANDDEQRTLYGKRVDLAMENENLRALLEGMHWRVMELEKACRKLKAQMTDMKTKKKSTSHSSRSLPRLCS